ncbi:hypothetical protein E2P86_08680 [Sphingobacterium psychroaquaticum]|uniref:hypothetical protein n=1 Tax=Sphingobacterium psychroaquaticum TaxID=561061 RepID=UPI00106B2D3C|nr:hypothetical protein [Sphingobacterium psychroaquaticum]QBQ41228.1 hypothetical protein E2P86_08680 [Sphingobacterium psychroaquaticum]
MKVTMIMTAEGLKFHDYKSETKATKNIQQHPFAFVGTSSMSRKIVLLKKAKDDIRELESDI